MNTTTNTRGVSEAMVDADTQLCTFYRVDNFSDLVRAMEAHIARLQQKLKDKRPWEDTFPPSPRA